MAMCVSMSVYWGTCVHLHACQGRAYGERLLLAVLFLASRVSCRPSLLLVQPPHLSPTSSSLSLWKYLRTFACARTRYDASRRVRAFPRLTCMPNCPRSTARQRAYGVQVWLERFVVVVVHRGVWLGEVYRGAEGCRPRSPAVLSKCPSTCSSYRSTVHAGREREAWIDRRTDNSTHAYQGSTRLQTEFHAVLSISYLWAPIWMYFCLHVYAGHIGRQKALFLDHPPAHLMEGFRILLFLFAVIVLSFSIVVAQPRFSSSSSSNTVDCQRSRS